HRALGLMIPVCEQSTTQRKQFRKSAEERRSPRGRGESMKVVTIVAFTLLVGLPAEAAQRRYQSTSPAVICNNDGHCTTFFAAPGFVARNGTSRRKTSTTTAVATTSSTSADSVAPAISTKEVVTPAVSATEAATSAAVVSAADSELSLEVALQPVHHFDFDVAVLFSDILVVPLVTGTATTET